MPALLVIIRLAPLVLPRVPSISITLTSCSIEKVEPPCVAPSTRSPVSPKFKYTAPASTTKLWVLVAVSPVVALAIFQASYGVGLIICLCPIDTALTCKPCACCCVLVAYVYFIVASYQLKKLTVKSYVFHKTYIVCLSINQIIFTINYEAVPCFPHCVISNAFACGHISKFNKRAIDTRYGSKPRICRGCACIVGGISKCARFLCV